MSDQDVYEATPKLWAEVRQAVVDRGRYLQALQDIADVLVDSPEGTISSPTGTALYRILAQALDDGATG